jgi:hypothetical protein
MTWKARFSGEGKFNISQVAPWVVITKVMASALFSVDMDGEM